MIQQLRRSFALGVTTTITANVRYHQNSKGSRRRNIRIGFADWGPLSDIGRGKYKRRVGLERWCKVLLDFLLAFNILQRVRLSILSIFLL